MSDRTMSKRQTVAPEYTKERFVIEPGARLHRLVSLIADTYIDDVTPERIEQIEKQVESWRWMNASGGRVS